MKHALIGKKFDGTELEIAQGSLERVVALWAGLQPELGDEWLEFEIVDLEPLDIEISFHALSPPTRLDRSAPAIRRPNAISTLP